MAALFHPGITAAEIARLTATPAHYSPRHRAEVSDLIATLESLIDRCHREAASWRPDMGGEMPYRYQEQLMSELLNGLRGFRAESTNRMTAARSAPSDRVPAPTGKSNPRTSLRSSERHTMLTLQSPSSVLTMWWQEVTDRSVLLVVNYIQGCDAILDPKTAP